MLETVAKIHTDFPSKFGIPRQSGLVEGLVGKIVLEPPFRSSQAVRGLEEFSHIWLIWGFSGNEPGHWSLTVRPPRLGGKKRMGVFATRSPFRPQPAGAVLRDPGTGGTPDPGGGRCYGYGVRTCWTGPPSTISNPTCPIPTATPRLPRGLPPRTRATASRWSSPLNCSTATRRITGRAAIEVLAQDPVPLCYGPPAGIWGVLWRVRYPLPGGRGETDGAGCSPFGRKVR